MKKFCLFIICMLLFSGNAIADDYLIDSINLRPAKTIYLPKGSFIKVTNMKEFSSQFLDEGDEITMQATYDLYIGETNIVPQKSIFYGTVEKVREPVQGTNAVIIIRMNKFVTPDGIPYNIDAYVSANGVDTFLGGGRTPALYYTRMPHYTRWQLTKWKVGAAQYCETNTRHFGTHTIVKPGAELILILQDNLDLVE